MKGSKKLSKIIVSSLVSIMMTLQLGNVVMAGNVYVKDTGVEQDIVPLIDGIPKEVAEHTPYVKIPVTYQGQNGDHIEVNLSKKKTDGYPHEQFDYSGTAVLRITAYAYQTGADVKIGTYIEAMGDKGKWVQMNWRDREDQVCASSLEEARGISLEVKSIEFSNPQLGHDNRLLIKIEASTGGRFERDTAKGIEFKNNSVIEVARTVQEVPGEKNVWEVQLAVKGNVRTVNEPTDVIIALDRSGSMQRPFIAPDGEGGIDMIRRAELVEEAASLFVEQLASAGINVGVVSFSERAELKEGLTKDVNKLKEAVRNTMASFTSGTAIADGLLCAQQTLRTSGNRNQVIILLSDGEPTYGSNHSLGDGYEVNDAIIEDLYSVVDRVMREGNNESKRTTLYTVAAGGEANMGRDILRNCATEDCYYEADDSVEALTNVLNKIFVKVEQTKGTTILEDELDDQFDMVLPADAANSKVQKVGLTSVGETKEADLSGVDWNRTKAAITQGTIQVSREGKFKWNIGKINSGEPAILCYRIKMTSGNLGQKYPISKRASLKYTGDDGQPKTMPVENQEVEAAWASVTVSNYLNGSLVGDKKEVWFDIPEGYNIATPLKISRDTTVITAPDTTLEARVGEGQTIKEIIGDFVDCEMINVTMNGRTEVVREGNEPAFNLLRVHHNMDVSNILAAVESEVEGDEFNCIQPESITNITAKLTLQAAQSRDVQCILDCAGMVNDQLVDARGTRIPVMNYDFSNASIQVKGNGGLYARDKYNVTVDPVTHKIIIDFVDVTPADDIIITVYMKSTLNERVNYANTADSYKALRAERTVDVDAQVTLSPKLTNQIINGVTTELWGEPQTVTSAIPLTYKEIAKIN